MTHPIVGAVERVIRSKMELAGFNVPDYARGQGISPQAAYRRFREFNSLEKLATACETLGIRLSEVIEQAEGIAAGGAK